MTFFLDCTEVPSGSVQISLINVKENFQQVTRKLQNYGDCILRPIVCMNCCLCLEVLILSATKPAGMSKNEVFVLGIFTNLQTNRSR